MATPYWAWCPTPGMGKTTRMAVDTNAYGDGYEHRATRGLNPARPDWNMSFPFVGETALQAMDDFLKRYAVPGFWIRPPGEPADVFVVCDEWSVMVTDKNNTLGLVGNLNATFRRTFNPQPGNAAP
jgi:phage-related protein